MRDSSSEDSFSSEGVVAHLFVCFCGSNWITLDVNLLNKKVGLRSYQGLIRVDGVRPRVLGIGS